MRSIRCFFVFFVLFLVPAINVSAHTSMLLARGERVGGHEPYRGAEYGRGAEYEHGGAYHPEARAYARGVEEGQNNAGGGGNSIYVEPESDQAAPPPPQ
jgi:hypothetical protein